MVGGALSVDAGVLDRGDKALLESLRFGVDGSVLLLLDDVVDVDAAVGTTLDDVGGTGAAAVRVALLRARCAANFDSNCFTCASNLPTCSKQ